MEALAFTDFPGKRMSFESLPNIGFVHNPH